MTAKSERASTLQTCWIPTHHLGGKDLMGWHSIATGSFMSPFLVNKKSSCWRAMGQQRSASRRKEKCQPTSPSDCQVKKRSTLRNASLASWKFLMSKWMGWICGHKVGSAKG